MLFRSYRTDAANDSEDIMKYMKEAPVADILKKDEYWGQDLSEMLPEVQKWYDIIQADGMDKAYGKVLA